MTKQRPSPWSFWLTACVLISFAALFITSDSPYIIILGAIYLISLTVPLRLPRDSGQVWGIRLLTYSFLALFSRPDSGGSFITDSQAFTSAGLVAAGEIVIQSWRERPRDSRFDGMMVTLSAIVFLVACNTLQYNLWRVMFIISPFYMASALFALRDIRPLPGRLGILASIRQYGLILLAVCVGNLCHGWLIANRGSIMAMGARLLTERRFPQRGGVGDTSTLRSGRFNPSRSTSRIVHIDGTLQDPHLRAGTFEDYNRGTWGPPLSVRTLKSALDADTYALMRGPFIDITLLRETDGQVFFPLNALALVPGAGSSFDWYQQAGPVKVDDQPPYTYHVIEAARPSGPDGYPTAQGPLCVPPSPAERGRLLAIPVGLDSRVRELALEITAQSKTPAQKVKAVTTYLLSHYRYNLEFQRKGGDPVVQFLLEDKAGHCQYFASAAVMLLRYAGVPTRYASGYYVHEEDGPAGWIVRTRDAHAWAESYVDGTGWVVVEATPPDGRADPNANPIPLLQMWKEKAQDSFARFRAWLGRLTQAQIAGLIVFILIIWGLERWRQALKQARRKLVGPVPPEELRPMARRFESVLARHGITLLPDRPWSETVPSEWQAGQEFIELYNRLRFHSIDREDLSELEAAFEKVEKAPPSPVESRG